MVPQQWSRGNGLVGMDWRLMCANHASGNKRRQGRVLAFRLMRNEVVHPIFRLPLSVRGRDLPQEIGDEFASTSAFNAARRDGRQPGRPEGVSVGAGLGWR